MWFRGEKNTQSLYIIYAHSPPKATTGIVSLLAILKLPNHPASAEINTQKEDSSDGAIS